MGGRAAESNWCKRCCKRALTKFIILMTIDRHIASITVAIILNWFNHGTSPATVALRK